MDKTFIAEDFRKELKGKIEKQRKKQEETDCDLTITDGRQRLNIRILSYVDEIIVVSDENESYEPDWLNVNMEYYDGLTSRQWYSTFLDAYDIKGIAGMLRDIRSGYIKDVGSFQETLYSICARRAEGSRYTVKLCLHPDNIVGDSTGLHDIRITQDFNDTELDKLYDKISKISEAFPSRSLQSAL